MQTAVRSSIPESHEHAVAVDEYEEEDQIRDFPFLESDLSHHDQFSSSAWLFYDQEFAGTRRVMVRRVSAEELSRVRVRHLLSMLLPKQRRHLPTVWERERQCSGKVDGAFFARSLSEDHLI